MGRGGASTVAGAISAPLPVPVPLGVDALLGLAAPPKHTFVAELDSAFAAQCGGKSSTVPEMRWSLTPTPEQGWPTPAPFVEEQAKRRSAASATDGPTNVVGSLEVLSLLRLLGEVTLRLSEYSCKEALGLLEEVPSNQRNTGWAKHQEGIAHFERADYGAALEAFREMARFSPHRTSGLAMFSTNLWHLKNESELCYLAKAAVEIDKLSPEAWCVVGNCFSLQKEHDVAIRFFRRALRLDPSFTYAYTLKGHEYVANEDFEKAVECYRHAIRVDPRHYNAWYGLGTIYYRQEKFQMAEYHFRRALAINPRSSVLYCYLGMVLHASNKYNEALASLEQAATLEPTNPQAQFQRAAVLQSMECYEAALEELQNVRDYAPREASVYFLMGKICKQLGRRDEAMMHFTTALDLDPKDSNMIKAAIDKLDSPDVDEEDDL